MGYQNFFFFIIRPKVYILTMYMHTKNTHIQNYVLNVSYELADWLKSN